VNKCFRRIDLTLKNSLARWADDLRSLF
jgi:hypothetical protein